MAMTPVERLAASRKLMRKRRYLVIGYPGLKAGSCCPGMLLNSFAGPLPTGFSVLVDGPTTRADWEAQCVVMFGTNKKARTYNNRPSLGEEFFRCTLIPSGGR